MRMALAVLFATGIAAHSQLLPIPWSMRPNPKGAPLRIGSGVRVQIEGYADPRVVARIALLPKGDAQLTIRIASAGSTVQSVDEDESYRLVVDSSHAVITAPNALGALYGIETFRQLAKAGTALAISIEDHPRFAWRGLMLDVSRHFMPPEVVRRTLDRMAAVKLNVFHWHLSDEQGFRVESKRFPKLQEQGSDGQFYTQEEIPGIVEHARLLGIRVVPEFDVPGHTSSWLVGYPELAVGPGPFQIARTWGLADPMMDPAKPEVYTFLDAFVAEMASLLPDAYFHIGGDELKFKRELQAGFNLKVRQILARHGKRMAGWDEVLNPALPRDVLVQSWRGAKTLGEAARLGHPAILSSGYYLDHMEPAGKMYMADPGTALGGEVCMWAEYVSAENVESRIWPRAAAVAERLWSSAAVRDIPDLYRRLDALYAGTDDGYEARLRRLAGSDGIEALRVLADVTEPGSLRVRHHANPNYTQQTPLDRFVDAVRPDSPTARHFAELADRYPATRVEIVKWLTLWAENDAKLEPSIAARPMLREAAPVSAALARISAQALAKINGAQSEPNSPVLQASQRPIGEVTLAVAAPIARIISKPASKMQ